MHSNIELSTTSITTSMNDEILEPISQRGSGAETAENRRIHEVANELIRRCQLYEAQLRNGQEHVTQ